MRRSIKRDRSRESVVIVCGCGTRAVRRDDERADQWIVDHLVVCQLRRTRDERQRIVDQLRDRASRRVTSL